MSSRNYYDRLWKRDAGLFLGSLPWILEPHPSVHGSANYFGEQLFCQLYLLPAFQIPPIILKTYTPRVISGPRIQLQLLGTLLVAPRSRTQISQEDLQLLGLNQTALGTRIFPLGYRYQQISRVTRTFYIQSQTLKYESQNHKVSLESKNYSQRQGIRNRGIQNQILGVTKTQNILYFSRRF